MAPLVAVRLLKSPLKLLKERFEFTRLRVSRRAMVNDNVLIVMFIFKNENCLYLKMKITRIK